MCIYDRDQLVALHPRSMDRHKEIEDPDHERQLVAQRSNAREQRLVVNFLALSPRAQGYLEGTRGQAGERPSPRAPHQHFQTG